MKTGNYLIIKESNNRYRFSHHLEEGEIALPILWCRYGLFCVIPKEVILNLATNNKMYRQSDGKRIPPESYVTWDQGIPISNLAGRALLGE